MGKLQHEGIYCLLYQLSLPYNLLIFPAVSNSKRIVLFSASFLQTIVYVSPNYLFGFCLVFCVRDEFVLTVFTSILDSHHTLLTGETEENVCLITAHTFRF